MLQFRINIKLLSFGAGNMNSNCNNVYVSLRIVQVPSRVTEMPKFEKVY